MPAISMRVLVVGGSPLAPAPELLRELAGTCDTVVAVDHGLDALLASGLGCDVFCGDADSVSAEAARLVEEAEGSGSSCEDRARDCGADRCVVRAVERYNPAKDYTDLSLALSAVQARWPGAHVVCTGLTGGRPDHALAALGQLAGIPGGAELVEDGFEARVLHAGQHWDIEDRQGATFSFVPVAPGTIVSESGMRWTLDHHAAPLLTDLGISNVISEPRARIICHTGSLIAWLFR